MEQNNETVINDQLLEEFVLELLKAKMLEDEKNKRRLVKLPINNDRPVNKKEEGDSYGKR